MALKNKIAIYWMLSLFLLSPFFALPIGTVSASTLAVNQRWSKTYGAVSGISVIKTTDGDYIIKGENATLTAQGYSGYYPILIKTDSAGQLKWVKNCEYEANNNIVGPLTGLIQTSDKGYLFSGPNSVVKTDTNGNILWIKNYYSTLAYTPVLENKADNGFYIIGQSGWVTKLDSDGNTEWNKTLYDSLSIGQVIQASDGALVLGGNVRNASGYTNGIILKSDSDGKVLWVQILDGNTSSVNAANNLIVETSNGYLSAGYLGNYFWIFKTDYDGNVQFSKTYGSISPYGAGFTIMATNSEGDCLLTGGGGANAWILKIQANGDTVWSKYYNLTSDFVFGFRSILPLDDGGLIAITDTTIVRIDTLGAVLGHISFNGRINSMTATILLNFSS